MKTLQDCKDRIAKRHGFGDWFYLYKVCNAYRIMEDYFPKAAELYGRYCRFVGYYKGKRSGCSEMIDYIKSEAEIPIPIERFFTKSGEHITKKQYGLVLIDVLCEELSDRFLANPPI